MSFAPRSRIKGARVVSRVPEILQLCRSKKVLHIGCTDMPYTQEKMDDLLHKKLLSVTKQDLLWGVDISEDGINFLEEMGFTHLLLANGEDLPTHLKDEQFDIILAAEVLEHVENVGQFLRSIVSVMSDTTELVLTTPNAISFRQWCHALLREEKVHGDHNYYFSFQTMKQLLGKVGLICDEIYYYQDVAPKGAAKSLDRAFSLVTRISPLWSDGLFVRASLRAEKILS